MAKRSAVRRIRADYDARDGRSSGGVHLNVIEGGWDPADDGRVDLGVTMTVSLPSKAKSPSTPTLIAADWLPAGIVTLPAKAV